MLNSLQFDEGGCEPPSITPGSAATSLITSSGHPPSSKIEPSMVVFPPTTAATTTTNRPSSRERTPASRVHIMVPVRAMMGGCRRSLGLCVVGMKRTKWVLSSTLCSCTHSGEIGRTSMTGIRRTTRGNWGNLTSHAIRRLEPLLRRPRAVCGGVIAHMRRDETGATRDGPNVPGAKPCNSCVLRRPVGRPQAPRTAKACRS